MINIKDKKNCCGCYACYHCCPQQCISMKSDDEGFWYPEVEMERCTDCRLCEKTCPIISKSIVDRHPLAYACRNKDDQIREQSSSGGVFTAIAQSVIANHGVVFGAAFDDDFSVLHSWTDSLNGLEKFRGSKYVQSYIGNTYQQAKDFLQEGRKVLFSGTPCQIAGLRSYLGKEDKNLICLDLICHGVPSPLVWQRYCSKLRHNKELKSISFRDKTYGWRRFSLKLAYKGGEPYVKDLSSDEFIKGFLSNVYLRPSCYHCNFKTVKRQSDITLADFWGVENLLPSLDDDSGTSLVLVNSPIGKEIFSEIKAKIEYETVNVDQALFYNPAAIRSVDYNPKREKFFQELRSNPNINRLISKYTKIGFFRKVYAKLEVLFGLMGTFDRGGI